jgi:hypothetical protein
VTVYPVPPEGGSGPVHVAETVDVPANSRGTITFTPRESGTVFYIPTVAVSKRSLTTYEVVADDTVRFPQSGVPPTDVDDFGPVFFPSLEFRDSAEVLIRNVDSITQSYAIQVSGWEQQERGE